MSKFLKIPYGNYTIEVQESGEIRLDTGENLGVVRITGDLIVEGSTTTSINSTDTDIKDNIITLNKGEIGFGIFKEQSGIQVDRGLYRNAFVVFDEQATHLDPNTAEIVKGSFVFKLEPGLGEDSTYEDEQLVGIKTDSITTNGTDLFLINQGSNVISVTGTVDYELNVIDDDHIPNKKYVDDAIVSTFGNGEFIKTDDTKVQTYDFDVTGVPSNIDFQVDGNTVVNIAETSMLIYDLSISSTTIQTENQDDNITLAVTGSGSVKIENVLEIPKSISDPAAPLDGIKIYSKEEGEGGTGIYYNNETGTQDELISRNRALLYSMVI